MATKTVKDLMERYGVAQHTVLAWIRSGELKAINVGVSSKRKKPRWRIGDDALEAFEKSRTSAPPTHVQAKRPRGPANAITEFYK